MPTATTRPFSLLVVVALVCVTAIISVQGLWHGADGAGWKQTIRSDAKGYYGYLQALFIRNDLGREAFVAEYTQPTPSGTLNKYFCGTSLMMAPWFGIGHAFALNDPEHPQDGTSVHEQKAISVGGWSYLFLGLLALRSLLLGLGVRDKIVAWTLAGLTLGTPLIQYAAMQPGWSHVYSFCVISSFLLAVHRITATGSRGWTIAAAALLAVIILIRPVNAMVLLAIPIVAGTQTLPLIHGLFHRYRPLLDAIFMFSAVIAIQPLLWHAQTGNWFEWGYQGEGFHWDRPEIVKVLFGFRRGLFLWTPLMLLVALGTIAIWRSDHWRSAWSMAYWMVCTYVISSWWIWYYGGGFGSRVYIDHYPVLVIPMVLMLHRWSGWKWVTARIFIVGCIALNLAQLWQYHNGFIHHECMDREKYAYSFLRFDDAHKDRLGGNYQAAPFNPGGMEMILEETCGMDDTCTYWSRGKRVQWEGAYTPSTVCLFDRWSEFGILFEASTDTLPVGRALFLEVGLQRFDAEHEGSLHALGITQVRNAHDSIYFYEPFPLNPLPGKPGIWEQLEYRIPVPPLSEGDVLSFYFWNKEGRASFLIDDVFMRVSAVRPY